MAGNPLKIAAKVREGLSPVCATCNKYWQARDRGIPGDRCMSKDSCGGPLAGGTFHEYDGPITDFSQWCFRCGDPSKYGIRARGETRVIGACEEHIKLMGTLRAIDGEVDLKYGIKSEEGDTNLQQIQGTPRKSLFKAIQEVEDHFAEDEGEES